MTEPSPKSLARAKAFNHAHTRSYTVEELAREFEYPRCATCRWFSLRSKNSGSCGLYSHISEMLDGYMDDPGDFGCISHEPKENDDATEKGQK